MSWLVCCHQGDSNEYPQYVFMEKKWKLSLNSPQTPSLSVVFAGCTSHFVGFVMLWLISHFPIKISRMPKSTFGTFKLIKSSNNCSSQTSAILQSSGYCHWVVSFTFHPPWGSSGRFSLSLSWCFFECCRFLSLTLRCLSSSSDRMPGSGDFGDGGLPTTVGNTWTPTEINDKMKV